MGVPFLDLQRIHETLKSDFQAAFCDIVDRSAFTNGDEVLKFEEAFAKWVGVRHCVGTSSGLDAEVIGLRAAGLRSGDRVILPAMTFIATIEAVSWAGGTPVLVDVDRNGLMDLNAAEDVLKTGAAWLLPVHLYGQAVNYDDIMALSRRYGAQIFEDACQAHGATSNGHQAGTFGVASGFSFYPGKNLGALGDGGALTTNDDELAAKARALREHGQTKKNCFSYEGYTSRLDTLQAAFLSIKLPHLTNWNNARLAAARYYRQNLSFLPGLSFQSKSDDPGHVYHLFVVLSDRQPALRSVLTEDKVGFGQHYPIPLHKMPCYAERSWSKKTFPHAEHYAGCSISLPIFPGITTQEQDLVISSIKKIHNE